MNIGDVINYRKILIISPGLIVFQKAFLLGLFSEGLIIWREFCMNSPWAYIQEGLLSEGYLCMRFGGAYFRGGLLSEFYGMHLSCRYCIPPHAKWIPSQKRGPNTNLVPRVSPLPAPWNEGAGRGETLGTRLTKYWKPI